MDFFDFSITSIASNIAKAYLNGNRVIKGIFYVASLCLFFGIFFLTLISSEYISKGYEPLTIVFFSIAGLLFLSIYGYQISLNETEAKVETKRVEKIIKESTNEAAASWELGRIKLESYLNRNLVQVRWIFTWTVIVMIAGFIIIGFGILKIYQGNENLSATIITTISGLIIEFIGASFLLIYKSTMQQASEYVNVLERINAVGMSVQIIESINKDESKLKDQAKADLAKKLLDLYGVLKIKNE